MKKTVLLTTLFLLIFSNLFAAAGTTSASFLKIGVGARNLALASVGAVNRDVNSIYYNPSGLCFLDQSELSVMNLQWLQDINYQHAAFADPKYGLGASVSYLSMGDIDKYDVNDTLVGKFSAHDFAGTAAYACGLRKDLFLGLAVKYISSQMDDAVAWTMAGDVGATYTGLKNVTLGAVVQNMGGGLKFVSEEDMLPLTFKVGGEYLWNYKRDITPRFYAEITKSAELDPYVSVAAESEFTIKDNLGYVLRAGYRSRDKEGNTVGFSAGAGMFINSLRVDLAWVPYGELGNTLAMSLNLKFGFMKEKNKEEETPSNEQSVETLQQGTQAQPEERKP